MSGSSVLTLGFALVDNFPTTVLAFSEATIGLILIALLIAYLPTIDSAFSRREAAVTMLEVRAGSPPSAVEMIIRYTRLKRLEQLGELWKAWEVWFVDLEESHTSLSALSFFRSPQPHRSWVTAAGAVLDGAALARSVFAPGTWLCAILPLSSASPTISILLRPTRLASRGRSLRRRWTKWPLPACLSKPIASRRGESSPAGPSTTILWCSPSPSSHY